MSDERGLPKPSGPPGAVLYRGQSLPLNDTRTSMGALVLLGVLQVLGIALTMSYETLVPVFAMPLFGLVLLIPTRFEVGADGIFVRWLWHRDFIPVQDIAYATTPTYAFGRDRVLFVEIHRKSGRVTRLGVGVPDRHEAEVEAIANEIRDRIACAAHARGDYVLALSRGERSVADWGRALRALGAGADASLRTAAIDPERLWRIVEDPAAPACDRVAAAVAVASSGDANAKARVRVAAAAIAEPKLRVAMDAASGDDDAIEEALRTYAR